MPGRLEQRREYGAVTEVKINIAVTVAGNEHVLTISEAETLLAALQKAVADANRLWSVVHPTSLGDDERDERKWDDQIPF